MRHEETCRTVTIGGRCDCGLIHSPKEESPTASPKLLCDCGAGANAYLALHSDRCVIKTAAGGITSLQEASDAMEKASGNLLDRWDMMANDTMGLLEETEPAFCRAMKMFREALYAKVKG